jgi:hypothetical protein
MANTNNSNSFIDAVENMDGGMLTARLDAALKETALSVAELGEKSKKGKVILEIQLDRVGESNQLLVKQTIKYDRLTLRGNKQEKSVTVTPMFCTAKGELKISPETQADIFSAAGKTPQPA